MVFQKFRRISKVPSENLRGHTDESKKLVHRHILKTVVKVVEEKFNFLCSSSLPAICRADPPGYEKLLAKKK